MPLGENKQDTLEIERKGEQQIKPGGVVQARSLKKWIQIRLKARKEVYQGQRKALGVFGQSVGYLWLRGDGQRRSDRHISGLGRPWTPKRCPKTPKTRADT